MKPTWNNYEISFRRAEKEFLQFDQEEIISASSLDADEDYIYVMYFCSRYRVCRKSGEMERLLTDGSWRHATYSEGMGIFDAICEPTPFRCLSGDMVDMGHFSKIGFNGSSLYQPYADSFCEHMTDLKETCLGLGGEPLDRCDVGFRFWIFDFLPWEFRLWEGEEGIPAMLQFYWDKNTPDFLRYETTHIILGHLLEEIREKMGLPRSPFAHAVVMKQD
ncbi:MAG: DUF3786 domain-containing protein [Firmicutes bacterium]|nr:DUF3786 domain-containing protein [Bacillota bacterium]